MLVTRKTFVLDTNVLLHDPESIVKFPDSDVILPVTVLEELDRLKRLPSEVGKNSREVIRYLDKLRTSCEGDLHQGVELENGSVLRLQVEIKTDYVESFSISISDNRIILACLWLKENGAKVVFVSKDFAARLKAEGVGIEAEDYQNFKVAYEAIYRGIRQLEVTKEQIDHFYKDGLLAIEEELYPNEYCALEAPGNSRQLAKYNQDKKGLEKLSPLKDLWGIEPRNDEQACAIDLLMRSDINLVTLVGPAGTGKTLLALACALRLVFDEGVYSRILVSRPIVPLGRDIGYLPGTKEEKLFHWMQPIYDNLEFLCESTGNEPNDTLRWVLDSKKIEMEAVTYIRGRSIPKQYFIIDEAQNLTPHEVKTIISRAGEGTKVVLTGDPTQIDNPYLDKDSNGLTYTVGCFAKHSIYGQIFLDKTERSPLAKLAAEIMH